MLLEVYLQHNDDRAPVGYYRSRVKNWCRAFAFVPVVWKLSKSSVTCSVKSRQRMGISKS